MANVTYPAGIATAYGAAVRGGYTGTYDDFCRQQAQYAESAAAVEQAKEDAEAAATAAEGSKTAAAGSASAAAASAGQASTSETNAANSATEANASKNAAANSATEAGNSATAAASSASDAQDSADDAQASAEAAAQSAASVDVHTDGNYPEMTVGTSEQLLSTQYVADKTPYLYRTTGGSSDVGNREYVRGITGGTVAWNQKVMHGNFDSTTDWYKGVGVDSWSASSNVLTANINGGSVLDPYKYGIWKNINGGLDETHKYLSVYGIKPSVATTFRLELGGGLKKETVTLPANVWSEVSLINTPSTYNSQIYLYPYSAVFNVPAPEMTIQYRNAQLFDLTAMFGSTIADYIYELETANAGAGVAFFRKLFPKPYYAYNAGELMSVQASSHEMVGFNQWDEEWELGKLSQSDGTEVASSLNIRSKNFCKALPNTAYCVHNGSAKTWMVVEYDENHSYVDYWTITQADNRIITFSARTRFFKVCSTQDGITTYGNDICINLSWSGTHNGEYKPYEKHTYALDSSLTLRGIPKLDASNNLYYDGDVYAPDGTVTRRYGIVDLGTLTWLKKQGAEGCFAATLPVQYKYVNNLNIISEKWQKDSVTANSDNGYYPATDKLFRYYYQAYGTTSAEFYVKDTAYDSMSATEFKTAMSGVYIVYELATPTTETADPYTEIQICDDWGTEEYVSTSIVPVGHTTDYSANLRDKLQHLPDLASADGNYIVSQSGTQMTLAPLPIVIPAPPTTDGTYTFRATVSNGVPTLSWVSE